MARKRKIVPVTAPHCFVVEEDQPFRDRFDVEVSWHITLAEAVRWLARQYTVDELSSLSPRIRDMRTGEVVY